MTRLKNTIVSTFAAGFFLIWTGVTSNISIVGMSVLLARRITAKLPIIAAINSEGRMQGRIRTAINGVTEMRLHNGILISEGAMKTDTLAGQKTIQLTADRETTATIALVTTELMTDRATRTSTGGQAVTPPTGALGQ
jgi:hypothetical protein